jgi:hypothetical protein
MKSCLGILLIFFTLIAILGGGALIWYLSTTAEFTRRAQPTATNPPAKAIPKALPVR